MTHTSKRLVSEKTFAPKRKPWFGGVFALLIIALLAYAVMLFMPASTAAGQSAAAVSSVPTENTNMLIDGMSNITHVLHVPGGYVDSNYELF